MSMMRKRLTESQTFRVWVLVRRDDYDGRMYAGVESYVILIQCLIDLITPSG